jgi:capsular polysaccharide biosynthesis protein
LAVEDVYKALWRHKLLIVVLTVIAAAAAWYVTSRETRIYESATLLRVQQKVTDPTQAYGVLSAGGLLAETYAQIVGTSAIRDRISQQLAGQADLSHVDISASAVGNLDLFWVKAQSPDPRAAQAAAAATPGALQAYIQETGTLRDKVITVQKAGLPSRPIKPNVNFNLTLAILLALIFNGALALVLEVLSDRITDLDELERVTGLPVLVAVPKLAFSDRATMGARASPQQSPAASPGDLKPRRASSAVREARGG